MLALAVAIAIAQLFRRSRPGRAAAAADPAAGRAAAGRQSGARRRAADAARAARSRGGARRARRSAAAGGCTSGWSRCSRCWRAVPMLLVTIFASLLFQYGVEFWFSDRARGMLENASGARRGILQPDAAAAWAEATVTMAGDLSRVSARRRRSTARAFAAVLASSRSITAACPKAVIVRGVAEERRSQTLALVNPYERRPRRTDHARRDRAAATRAAQRRRR